MKMLRLGCIFFAVIAIAIANDNVDIAKLLGDNVQFRAGQSLQTTVDYCTLSSSSLTRHLFGR